MLLKKIYIKIDDKRETIEDFIADKILFNLDENEKVDALEEKAILAAMDAAALYLKLTACRRCRMRLKRKSQKQALKQSGRRIKKFKNN